MAVTNDALMAWFADHSDHYSKVRERLDAVRRRFENADREQRRDMLLASYEFAVISVQTPLHIHEKAWSAIRNGDDPEDAMQEVNYWRNKVRYMNESRVKFDEIDEVCDALLAGKLDRAHKLLIDEFLGVGAKKAAFVLAMLGYTSKMCIDTNVEQAAGLDDAYSGVVVDRYETCCDRVREQYDIDDSFMLQWALFDYQRGAVASHDVYFRHQLPEGI